MGRARHFRHIAALLELDKEEHEWANMFWVCQSHTPPHLDQPHGILLNSYHIFLISSHDFFYKFINLFALILKIKPK